VATVADDPDETLVTLEAAVAGADLLVVSGGVSVGAHDHVKGSLAELGVERVFWRIGLKPGKPTWFGAREEDRALVLGLPGNPVSSMVCFTLLARPALRAMQGADPTPGRVLARLDEDFEAEPNRMHAVRCRLEVGADGRHARHTGGQGSNILTSMLGADGLALIPAGTEPLPAGSEVEVELLPR
jgi:molybdopterin molybdotransferase